MLSDFQGTTAYQPDAFHRPKLSIPSAESKDKGFLFPDGLSVLTVQVSSFFTRGPGSSPSSAENTSNMPASQLGESGVATVNYKTEATAQVPKIR